MRCFNAFLHTDALLQAVGAQGSPLVATAMAADNVAMAAYFICLSALAPHRSDTSRAGLVHDTAHADAPATAVPHFAAPGEQQQPQQQADQDMVGTMDSFVAQASDAIDGIDAVSAAAVEHQKMAEEEAVEQQGSDVQQSLDGRANDDADGMTPRGRLLAACTAAAERWSALLARCAVGALCVAAGNVAAALLQLDGFGLAFMAVLAVAVASVWQPAPNAGVLWLQFLAPCGPNALCAVELLHRSFLSVPSSTLPACRLEPRQL